MPRNGNILDPELYRVPVKVPRHITQSTLAILKPTTEIIRAHGLTYATYPLAGNMPNATGILPNNNRKIEDKCNKQVMVVELHLILVDLADEQSTCCDSVAVYLFHATSNTEPKATKY